MAQWKKKTKHVSEGYRTPKLAKNSRSVSDQDGLKSHNGQETCSSTFMFKETEMKINARLG